MGERVRRRTREHWWTTPLGFIVAFAMAFAAIWPSLYVTEHLSAWAAPLVWAALAICALACVGYFTSKVNGFLACGIVGFTLSLAMGVSLVEGWESQIQIAINIAECCLILGSVALVVGLIVFGVRLHRRVYVPIRDDLRTVGEEIHTDALFRDDGERINVQPDRWRLLVIVIGLAVFMAGCALGLWFALTQSASPFIIAGVGLLLVLGVLLHPLYVARLVMHGPTVVIGPDGVLDRGSQIVTGRGLLRWDEIVAVFEYAYKPNKIGPTYRMLMFLLTDARAVHNRQPIIKRALSFLGREQLPGTVVVVRALLDQAPDALAEQIRRYAKSHAPRGWVSPLIAEDVEDENGSVDESENGNGAS